VALAGRVPAFSVVGEATALAVPTAVRQIVLNLAKNAAEAAGPSGRVEIRLGQDGSRALVTVSDDGPGIAPEARERIFDPFFTTKQTGTGLGLAIARAMAGALGGDLELESGDGGARFTLRLPLATPGRRT
jgi:signal transduction histidine kinase